jgi:hypothetical protein
MSLACIADKFLENLWAMQAQAAESSGYAGQSCCFLGRRIQKHFAEIHLF